MLVVGAKEFPFFIYQPHEIAGVSSNGYGALLSKWVHSAVEVLMAAMPKGNRAKSPSSTSDFAVSLIPRTFASCKCLDTPTPKAFSF